MISYQLLEFLILKTSLCFFIIYISSIREESFTCRVSSATVGCVWKHTVCEGSWRSSQDIGLEVDLMANPLPRKCQVITHVCRPACPWDLPP